MTRNLGWLQVRILAVLRSDPRVWLYTEVATEVYGEPWDSLQFQALANAMRTLARRELVEVNPPHITEWGQPDQRQRARLAA